MDTLMREDLLANKVEAVSSLLISIELNYAPACFACSFGIEDMVLVDLICKHAPKIEVFTLDTGRLPQETYELIQKVKERYARPVNIYFPETQKVETYVEKHGPNGFYESVALRKECCRIRKVEPLKRALAGKKAWITGVRRGQSVTRKDLSLSKWDVDHKLQKFNPLIEWSEDEVWDYVRRFDLPYNTLYNQGYASIGCAPCTRAITIGEDIRAGRWWWEDAATKECGLHLKRLSIG
ncbi:phosphoadenylylsulfate reductase (thioredoxin) [Nitrosococcus oceani ATCC 19707]|uniref:Adenosine 5'-phosphosulfate reductase n=2 Tax=Nitrosococcus oceani TaxID=1229 RepID=Q3J8U8_NITOC|nr:phosphoadenylyl-sulfate reductase [Nitrosococcus oceani]ABA58748.1 phosphoadenylylsulfate reductase (thioredoxin) [Nitrosococcus oceani ATCC 19707]KFI18828.1 phosphoadenosine phosphosulfate reductase [Nitrosococcus oceani C-27]GEM19160.1 phosphoadenosine phosphosulfate reductase [Nitrosococcus oceani]